MPAQFHKPGIEESSSQGAGVPSLALLLRVSRALRRLSFTREGVVGALTASFEASHSGSSNAWRTAGVYVTGRLERTRWVNAAAVLPRQCRSAPSPDGCTDAPPLHLCWPTFHKAHPRGREETTAASASVRPRSLRVVCTSSGGREWMTRVSESARRPRASQLWWM